jgi:hypothetical protein
MNELMTKAIAQAYEDGYRNGYKDRDSDIAKFEVVEHDVDVCDLREVKNSPKYRGCSDVSSVFFVNDSNVGRIFSLLNSSPPSR